jgi:hypothetical protein
VKWPSPAPGTEAFVNSARLVWRAIIGLWWATATLYAGGCDASGMQIAAAQDDYSRPAIGEHVPMPPQDEKAGVQKTADTVRENDVREALCLIVESAAKVNDLPLEFFGRVIWQESRFQPQALGPVTRNGQRAQGIAQFMPRTATERGLLDPFDPVQALPKSAEFLSDLRNQFGNLGLAAAAYNAGPKRVQDWLAGSGEMPLETRNYVAAITGLSVEDWAKARREGKIPEISRSWNCRELMALLKGATNPFVTRLKHSLTVAAAKPWGVQVAAGFSRDNALMMYARAMKEMSFIAKQVDPSSTPILFRSRGTTSFYQVRLGTDTQRGANDLCGRIRRNGGACLVKRNIEIPRHRFPRLRHGARTTSTRNSPSSPL